MIVVISLSVFELILYTWHRGMSGRRMPFRFLFLRCPLHVFFGHFSFLIKDRGCCPEHCTEAALQFGVISIKLTWHDLSWRNIKSLLSCKILSHSIINSSAVFLLSDEPFYSGIYYSNSLKHHLHSDHKWWQHPVSQMIVAHKPHKR